MESSSTVGTLAPSFEMPAWKSILGHLFALVIGILFVGAGGWKAVDPMVWSKNLEVFKVPHALSLPATLLLATTEVFGGIMILMPNYRRWGSKVTLLLLLIFTGYFAYHYTDFRGMDCTCFPGIKWLQRSVGPEFFISEGAMIAAAALAGLWAKPAAALRGVAVILGIAVVFSGVSYGVAASKLSGVKAPDSIVVDGKPYSLQNGEIFLFFYSPVCPHCEHAARVMSKLHWKQGVTIIALPTTEKQFAAAFLHDTELTALTSLEAEELKKTFPYGDPPYGVALHNGRMTGPVAAYEENEPEATLKKLGLVE